MTVAELIEELKFLPQDQPVLIYKDRFCSPIETCCVNHNYFDRDNGLEKRIVIE